MPPSAGLYAHWPPAEARAGRERRPRSSLPQSNIKSSVGFAHTPRSICHEPPRGTVTGHPAQTVEGFAQRIVSLGGILGHQGQAWSDECQFIIGNITGVRLAGTHTDKTPAASPKYLTRLRQNHEINTSRRAPLVTGRSLKNECYVFGVSASLKSLCVYCNVTIR